MSQKSIRQYCLRQRNNGSSSDGFHDPSLTSSEGTSRDNKQLLDAISDSDDVIPPSSQETSKKKLKNVQPSPLSTQPFTIDEDVRLNLELSDDGDKDGSTEEKEEFSDDDDEEEAKRRKTDEDEKEEKENEKRKKPTSSSSSSSKQGKKKKPIPLTTIKSSSSSSGSNSRKTRRKAIDGDENQMLLDAGQKQVGPIVCPVCQMFYHPRHGQDVKLHEKNHAEYLYRGNDTEKGKNGKYRVAAEFKKVRPCQKLTENMYITSEQAGHIHTLKDFSEGKIVRVGPADSLPSALKKKISETVDYMNEELGFVPQDKNSLWLRSRSIYLVLNAGRSPTIIGCAIVDSEVPKGGRFLLADDPPSVAPNTDEANVLEKSFERPDSPQSVVSSFHTKPLDARFRDKNKPYAVEIGINRIWIHGRYRQQGLAESLLDTIRNSFRPEFPPRPPVPKTRIAFTDPTEAGKNFMVKYCNGKHNVLIYEVNY